ncbi:MAG TPA: hypothetical protein VN754_06400, partial [Candidatus Binataceae bacterium]|nr:hypothetical protein [Candidatus Binataceae bacterium]
LLADVACGRDHDCRNSRFFKNSRNQTHGLMIERSGGHECCTVNLIVLELTRERWRGLVNHRGACKCDP